MGQPVKPRSQPGRGRGALAAGCLLVAGALAAPGSEPAGGAYRIPPQVLVDVADAVQPPSASVDPRRQWLLLSEPESWPSIADLARREMRLGGLRADPLSHYRAGASLAPPFAGLPSTRP